MWDYIERLNKKTPILYNYMFAPEDEEVRHFRGLTLYLSLTWAFTHLGLHSPGLSVGLGFHSPGLGFKWCWVH